MKLFKRNNLNTFDMIVCPMLQMQTTSEPELGTVVWRRQEQRKGETVVDSNESYLLLFLNNRQEKNWGRGWYHNNKEQEQEQEQEEGKIITIQRKERSCKLAHVGVLSILKIVRSQE